MAILFQSQEGVTPSWSVELMNPAPFGWDTPAGNKTELNSGYFKVQISDVNPFERTFTCQTKNLADILDLEGKKGEYGDLVIDGVVACTHAALSGKISTTRFGPNSYEYIVTVTQSV